jgi:RNA polymerase sigma factor (sigma-70 family)
MTMRDREAVASIVAGDPAGLAAAYDKYAGALYVYCRSFLREPADAADAVHDTFVIAAASLNRLRDPERLRPWLYAVARSLCLRRLRANKAAPSYLSPEFLPGEEGEDSGVGGDAERAELRALLRAAGGGLNAPERDIVELRLWQGLDAAEAAAVLGITRGHAHSLLSRGRDELTASVAALLVARTGREDCAVLDRLLTGWDGQLTVLMRKRLSRHIERCDICSDRRRRELRPALLSLWPAAALAGATLAERAAHTAGVPQELRAQVLKAAADKGAHAAATAAGVGRFKDNGFPEPGGTHPALAPHRALRRGTLRRGTRAHINLWSSACAGAAVIAAAVFAGTHFLGHPGEIARSAAGPGGSATSSAGTGGAAPPSSPAGRPGRVRRGSAGTGGSGGGGTGRIVPVVTLRPGTGPSAGPGSSAAPPASPPSSSSSGAAPSSSSSGAAPSSSAPAAAPLSPAPPASSPSSPPPSSSPPSSSPPASPPSSPPSTASGTLSVSPTSVVLTPLLGSSLTLTAEGGPVSWSISEPGSLLGELVVSPSSGTLAAGQSVEVSITVSGLASLDTTLTVNPGGQAVTVVLGLGL